MRYPLQYSDAGTSVPLLSEPDPHALASRADIEEV